MAKSYRQVITHYGNIYHKTHTITGTSVARFSTASLLVNTARILVTTNDAKFGGSTGQDYAVAANDALELEKFDLMSLYFKNAASTANAVITIVAVRG